MIRELSIFAIKALVIAILITLSLYVLKELRVMKFYAGTPSSILTELNNLK